VKKGERTMERRRKRRRGGEGGRGRDRWRRKGMTG